MQAAVPGPSGLPFVGALAAMSSDPLRFMTEAARTYGDVVTWKVGTRPLLLINHPDDVEDLLVRQRDSTIKDSVTRGLSAVLGQGLLTSDGDVWARQRKMAAPSFRPRHMSAYATAMVRSAQQRPIALGEQDIHLWMSRVTLDIVLRTLFGTEPGGEGDRVGGLLDVLATSFEHEQRSVWRLIPGWVPNASRRRRDHSVRELDTILARITSAPAKSDDTLLARLQAAQDEEGKSMSPRELRDALLTLFLAGHETTSLALSFTMWLLAEHPEVQQRVHEELDDVLGSEAPGAVVVRQLPVLDAVLSESMRLYPPAWVIGRELVAPVPLAGRVFPAGTDVICSQWVVHRDPRWFVGADRFRPDRWLNGETDRLHRFAFFPFGGGPRVCIGNHFARMEAILVLACVLQRFRVRAVSGFVPALSPAVTLRSRNGLWCGIERRL